MDLQTPDALRHLLSEQLAALPDASADIIEAVRPYIAQVVAEEMERWLRTNTDRLVRLLDTRLAAGLYAVARESPPSVDMSID